MNILNIPDLIERLRREWGRIRFASFSMLLACSASVFGIPSSSESGPGRLIPVTATRKFVDLNGEWTYRKRGEAVWQSVSLPHPTEEIGHLFYRRTFSLERDTSASQSFLVFEGINFSSRVRLNDQYISTQSHGHTSFQVLIPSSLLRLGSDNILEVEVNTALDDRSIPLRHALLSPRPLRGIFRDICLVTLPSLAIYSARMDADFFPDLSAVKLNFQIEVGAHELALPRSSLADPASLQPRLVYMIREERLQDRIVASGEQTIEFTDDLRQLVDVSFDLPNPRLWNLSSPRRYILELQLRQGETVLDSYRQKIGLRELTLGKNEIHLNGTPTPLKGITYVEDRQRVLTRRDALSILQKIKALGFNTISWFSPPPDHTVSAADSLGILSIFQLPVWNVPGSVLADPGYQERAGSLFEELSKLTSRHASGIALSLGEGFDPASAGTHDFLGNLLTAAGARKSFFLTAGFRNYDDSLSELRLDFLTFDLTFHRRNEWRNWLARWLADGPGSPVLIADISIPYVSSRPDSENVSRYEAQQAYHLKNILSRIQREPNMGFVLSTLNDWRLCYPSMLSLSGSNKMNLPIGLADFDETPRMALNMVRNMNHGTGYQFEFEKHPEDHADVIFIIYGLVIITVFLYFFRKDHRLHGNFIRVLSRPFGFHVELKDGRRTIWPITIIILLTSVSTWGLILGGAFSFLRTHPLFDFLISQLSPIILINTLLIEMSWHPIPGVAGFSIVVALILSALGIYVFFLSLTTGRNLSIRGAMTLVYWESCIFIFLLPMAFILYRLLSLAPIRLLLLVLLGIFILWYVYRIFVGVQTVLAFSPGLTVALILGIPLLAAIVLDILYNQTRGLNAQLGYLFHIWKMGS